MIPKSEIIPAEFYQSYIDLIKESDFREAIKKNSKQFRKLVENIPRKKFDYAYAEGKWTIRQMLQHIIDAERVFSYRALRLSRKDATPLPGFDENQWAANDGGATRKWKDLLEEFGVVREATEYLYDALTDEQLRFVGTVNERPLNAFTIGFIIPGHVTHHMHILEARYL
ncbi:DinB family protein [Puia dinghuensis]|uniref:DNA damage-inducible protein DinB n=1 Tax=Puia dinghuensis TaxID=1792502 RepID=A0A8J2XNB6_9BACT|nr:DinB family protein [Puia dinghuensis]GGA83166.1 DNA damage-inducible protein DinB [Puia dinghuensis]